MANASRTGTLTRSVIICCYADERWDQLCGAVDSATAQLAAADELIVVVDHNPALLERASRRFETATVLPNDGASGLSGARNTGVATARGDLVVFLDDDATACGGWLDALTAPFADRQVAGVGGAADPQWQGGSAPWWMPEEYHWVVGCSYVGLPTEVAEVRNPIGCNMAFRRSALEAVGGFSTELGRVGKKPVGGEETDVSIRISQHSGGTVRFVPAARVDHAVPTARMTPGYFASRCFFEGRSKAILARRVGTMDATEAERGYLGTLGRGSLQRLGQVVEQRSLRPLGQVAAMLAGLVFAGLGFLLGTAQSLDRQRRVSAEER